MVSAPLCLPVLPWRPVASASPARSSTELRCTHLLPAQWLYICRASSLAKTMLPKEISAQSPIQGLWSSFSLKSEQRAAFQQKTSSAAAEWAKGRLVHRGAAEMTACWAKVATKAWEGAAEGVRELVEQGCSWPCFMLGACMDHLSSVFTSLL